MLEYVDPDTGEVIKTLVDKVKKKKITPLKKAILQKRNQIKVDRLISKREKQALKLKKEGDDSYETISEKSETDEVNESHQIEELNITEGNGQSRTGYVKYRHVFEDLEEIAKQVEQMLFQPSFAQNVRAGEKSLKNEAQYLKEMLNDIVVSKCTKSNKFVREYVDIASN